jgi:glycerophosphoryl diester phosphodiesterase
MRIIAHRGAKGLAPENTIASIIAGVESKADAIEFDIRVSSDQQLVLSHDASLKRTHGVKKKVHHMKASEIKKVQSPDGHGVPTLQEALKAAGDRPVFIEGKRETWAPLLAKAVDRMSKSQRKRTTVISFDHQALDEFSDLCPDVPVYVLDHHNAFDAINAARVYGFDGIDVNFWTLNPLAYWLARRHKLEITVYTVNKPWQARLIHRFYPDVNITTDHPHQMEFLQQKRT